MIKIIEHIIFRMYFGLRMNKPFAADMGFQSPCG